MKQHPVIQALGKVCNTCKYYDTMEGYCSKKSGYKHGYAESCEKWKIADDLKQSRPKPRLEKVNLLKIEQTIPKPTPQELEDFFNGK